MDRFETQRKIFTINAVLLLLAVIGLIIAIPSILRDIYPGSEPRQAAIATAVGACLHLLLFIGFFTGATLARRQRRINREINIVAAVVMVIFGFIIMDGAAASIGHALLTSIGFFTCVACDLAAVIVSVVALFLIRSKKRSQPGMT